ncbi:unnamed protein product [Caenorhabditis auriculariae]|uniref:Uncharacterized protein n=1 Tax=Caenorhabditis auriculariae TaxID=2777116 RepID=A0A8S1HF14_9PELO|nr:unnamed protein product [Caenorhabditis auriculariae]
MSSSTVLTVFAALVASANGLLWLQWGEGPPLLPEDRWMATPTTFSTPRLDECPVQCRPRSTTSSGIHPGSRLDRHPSRHITRPETLPISPADFLPL